MEHTKMTEQRLREIGTTPENATNREVAEMARELYRHRLNSTPDMFGDVRDFNMKFGLPYTPRRLPGLLGPALREYRLKFIKEEVKEFEDAATLADAADALVDLVYVALGTAHFMGIPFDACWREVQRANMAKEKNDGSFTKPRTEGLPIEVKALDIMKPAGWLPPDHDRVIREHSYVWHDRTMP